VLRRIERIPACLRGEIGLASQIDSLARREAALRTAWTLQDAKNRFSEVVEHALNEGPQTITRRGKETAVLLSVGVFRALSAGKGDLVRFFRQSPLADADIDLDRRRDYGREVGL
jgi:prevent-host-death family protein